MPAHFLALALGCVLDPQVLDPGSPFPVFARWEGASDPAIVKALLDSGITGFVIDAADDAGRASIGDAPRIVDGASGPTRLFAAGDYEDNFEDYLVTRDPRLAIREHCPLREPTRGLLFSDLDSLVKEASPPFAISVARDPSWTSMSAPHDFCACEACVARWRRDLAARFPDVAAAAAALGIEVDAWERIEPWGVDRVRAWNEDLPRSRVQLGPWLDHRESQDAAFAAAIGELARRARERTGAPTGFLGGALSNAFGGHDWARLARSVDLLQPPEDPTSREVAIAHGGKIVFCALNPTAGEQRYARRQIAEALFSGARGAIVAAWSSWLEPEGESGRYRPTKLARAAAPLLSWARGDAGEAWTRARPRAARVKLLYSPRSLKIHWLIDAETAGIYWPTLASQHDGELLPMARTWWGWQWLLQDLQAPYSWLDEDALETNADALADLGVLVLPRVISLSARAEARIRDFVAAGGKVLIDGECGLFDELGNGLARGRLDDLCGVERDDADSPWDAERPGLASVPFASLEELRDLEARASVKSGGHQNVFWLDRSIADYVDVRSASTGDRGAVILERIAKWIGDSGGNPGVRIARKDSAGPACVRIRIADEADAVLLGVTRTDIPPELNDPGGEIPADVPVEYVLELSAPRIVEDLSPGATSAITSRDPAPSTRVEFALPIEGCALFRIREPR